MVRMAFALYVCIALFASMQDNTPAQILIIDALHAQHWVTVCLASMSCEPCLRLYIDCSFTSPITNHITEGRNYGEIYSDTGDFQNQSDFMRAPGLRQCQCITQRQVRPHKVKYARKKVRNPVAVCSALRALVCTTQHKVTLQPCDNLPYPAK
jgi:hypothetical protein